jgi:acetyl esterase/lipase
LLSLRAAESGLRVLLDVPYLGADRVEKLDVYLPEPSAAGARSPAVVWIHGGGWMGGTKSEARAKEICSTLAAHGYVAVSIDYKLGAGAWPTNLLDCKNAVRFLRASAAKYHIDSERIAVAGGSAGGHLSCMVGFTTGEKDLEPNAPYPGISSAVRCVIDMYGPTDLLTRRETTPSGEPKPMRKLMTSSATVFGAKDADDPVLSAASAVTHVTKNSPPVLILHGRADTTVDYAQSQELDAVLTKFGVAHELILIDGIGHTFDWEKWSKKPLPKDLRPVALAFLAKHMGP